MWPVILQLKALVDFVLTHFVAFNTTTNTMALTPNGNSLAGAVADVITSGTQLLDLITQALFR
jgi:hypothetical protein